MIIACVYAGPFFMKPDVFLKYDSVNSECTLMIRKGTGLINSILWMRKLIMSSVDRKIQYFFLLPSEAIAGFNISFYCLLSPW